MNKIFVFIVLVNSVLIPEGTSTKLKELQKNLFHQVHLQIHDTVNKIFRLLCLSSKVKKNYNNKLLLSMHNSMKTIAEDIFLEHQSVKKVAKLKDTNKPKEGHFNLEKTVQMIIDETFKPITGKAPSNHSKIAGVRLALTSAEIPDDSEESIAFLKEYLYKVKGSEIYGFDTPTHKIKQLYEHYKLQTKKDIKTWRAQNSTEDLNKTLTRRIYNGKDVKVKKFPFIASVHVMGDFTCAASIIRKEWAITAAVCLHIAYKNKNFVQQNPSAITIRTGSDYTVRFGQECAISKIIFHPDYDPETLRNNLALIKFRLQIQFRRINKQIRKIDYESFYRHNANIHQVLMLGWGSKDSQVSYGHDPLTSSSLDIYDFKKCQKIYSSKFVSNSNFCAGFQNKGSGACQRDAGGPGIVNSVLIGVVSFGPPVCGAPGAPTVFTTIDLYTEWIDAVVKEKPFITTTDSTVTTTITTKANFEKPLRFGKLKQQKIKYKTGLNIPQTQYPNVIRVVSELLKNLIIGQDIESIAYEDSKEGSDSDDSPAIVIGNDGILSDDRADILNMHPKKITTQIIKPNILKSNIYKNINTNYNSMFVQPVKGKINPYFSAAKSLQGHLGFDNLFISRQAQSNNATNYLKSDGSANLLPKAQNTSNEELVMDSTDLSDNDNSGTGLSIEVSFGITTESTVKGNKANQVLAQFPNTQLTLETFLDQKTNQLFKSFPHQPQPEKSSKLPDIRKLKQKINRIKQLQKNYNTIQQKSFKTRYTRVPTRLWKKKVLYSKSSDELKKTNSAEKTNLNDEYSSDSYNFKSKRNTKMHVSKTVPSNKKTTQPDTSESLDNTKELQALAEQIRSDLLEMNSRSNRSTQTMITNDDNVMGSEEQSDSENNRADLSILDTRIKYEATHASNERPLQNLKMSDTGKNRLSYNIITKEHHRPRKQLHFVEEKHRINSKLHAERKSIQNDDLSQVDNEEVGRQLLDYINV